MTEATRAPVRAYRRCIGEAGDGHGPGLVVVAGIHGNEPSGVHALERVFAQIDDLGIRLRGSLVGLTGNIAALEAGERFLREDLNRMWRVERLLRRSPNGSGPESHEQRELLESLSEIARETEGRLHLLDLHTASSTTAPFYVLGDTLSNREFARGFPAIVVLGFEDHIRGTLMEYMTSLGHVAIAIEGGRHDDPQSIERHVSAIWLALVRIGCVDAASVPEHERHVERLAHAGRGLPRVLEVFHRHRLTGREGFRMDPGFSNFDRVRKGQRLATDRNGEVRSPADGLLFLPLYQKRGDDGFFLARSVNPWWLALTSLLRRLGVPRLARRLPGVRVHPLRKDTLVVDLGIARIGAATLFRMLGYRIERRVHRQMLVRKKLQA